MVKTGETCKHEHVYPSPDVIDHEDQVIVDQSTMCLSIVDPHGLTMIHDQKYYDWLCISAVIDPNQHQRPKVNQPLTMIN